MAVGARLPAGILTELRPKLLRRALVTPLLARADGIWTFRYPEMPGRLRRLLLAAISMDRFTQRLRYASRLAGLRAADAALTLCDHVCGRRGEHFSDHVATGEPQVPHPAPEGAT